MKLIVLFVILATAYASSGSPSPDPKIVDGQNAVSGQFKFIASLRNAKTGRHFCGSTIISSRTLVTAAHCFVTDPVNIEVMAGTTRQNDTEAQMRRVRAFITHPEYEPQTNSSDLALVILDTDLDFNELVQPVKLPNAPTIDAQLTTCGWGLTSYPGVDASNDLQWFRTKTLPAADCQMFFPVMTGKLCTLTRAGQGVCAGDSGSPMVNDNGELVGTTCFAFVCALGLPDLFTDVFYYKEWILENAQM